MNKEEIFRDNLEKIVRAGRCNHNYVSEEKIKEQFREDSLNETQLQMVEEYLGTMGIKIGIYAEAEETEQEFNAEDVSFLQMYLDELEQLPKHNEEERKQIILGAMKGDEKSRQDLINDYLPEVVDIAKLYVDQGVSLEDLISEGNVGLMLGIEILSCVETVDEVMGHLGKMIMDSMDAAIARGNDEREFDRKCLERIEQISLKAKELSGELRQEITAEELAREMNIPIEDILEAMELTGDGIEGIAKRKQ